MVFVKFLGVGVGMPDKVGILVFLGEGVGDRMIVLGFFGTGNFPSLHCNLFWCLAWSEVGSVAGLLSGMVGLLFILSILLFSLSSLGIFSSVGVMGEGAGDATIAGSGCCLIGSVFKSGFIRTFTMSRFVGFLVLNLEGKF